MFARIAVRFCCPCARERSRAPSTAVFTGGRSARVGNARASLSSAPAVIRAAKRTSAISISRRLRASRVIAALCSAASRRSVNRWLISWAARAPSSTCLWTSHRRASRCCAAHPPTSATTTGKCRWRMCQTVTTCPPCTAPSAPPWQNASCGRDTRAFCRPRPDASVET